MVMSCVSNQVQSWLILENFNSCDPIQNSTHLIRSKCDIKTATRKHITAENHQIAATGGDPFNIVCNIAY